MLLREAYCLISHVLEYIIRIVKQIKQKGVLKMKELYFQAYPYGKATLEQLERIYNNYGIACECDADELGYFIRAEQLKEA